MDPKFCWRTLKKRRRFDVNRDLISELPDALLIQILSLLPTIDAVGTCVLSKRWSSLWQYLPKLDYHYQNGRTSLRLSPQFVHRFLLLNKSLLLESMRLIVESDCEAVDIGIWIGYAVERGLRELELDPNSENGYIRLPSNIYACQTLEVLKLKSYVRVDVPDSPVCFKSLKILHLHLVYYEDDDSVRRLFSSCPNLEELDVKRYIDNVIKFVIESPSLKRLSIRDCSDGDGQRGYVINAPSLNYLSIKGPKDFEFSLEYTPKLVEANITNISNIKTEKILLPLASSVKRLSLSLSHLETRYAASIIFHQLVYLELGTRETEWWNLLMNLLMNSPQLQALKLSDGDGKYSEEHETNPPFTKPISVPPCLLSHLQIFEWEGYNGQREEEIQVATYILTNAKHLTKANFSTDYKYFTADEKLEMLQELAREPKASTSCYFFFE
ncbi:PREDICTED: F-box/LRR-repeat protein At3g26922-like [Camelina sativa]|uniref:F-box/LRR-repeat protein At3g26922-like n=1 Tax=Camelina sativa TaxID=90675 RepID=A0ABM0V5P6_CAMSA|nr:PREDICTED: F-box/LRR-repeat protein At3g26922-like [Camelina sativa]